MNPSRDTSGCECKNDLIGLSLLSEISARQAFSSHVPLTYYLPAAAANCILLLVCACECDYNLYGCQRCFPSTLGRKICPADCQCVFERRCVLVSVQMLVYECVHLKCSATGTLRQICTLQAPLCVRMIELEKQLQ